MNLCTIPSKRALEMASRPDSNLPPELRSREIREVRDVSTAGKRAYQIVFDQHYLPFPYWNPKPDGWEMTYARTEYHNDYSGILGWLVPDKECITIVVSKDVDDHLLSGNGGNSEFE